MPAPPPFCCAHLSIITLRKRKSKSLGRKSQPFSFLTSGSFTGFRWFWRYRVCWWEPPGDGVWPWCACTPNIPLTWRSDLPSGDSCKTTKWAFRPQQEHIQDSQGPSDQETKFPLLHYFSQRSRKRARERENPNESQGNIYHPSRHRRFRCLFAKVSPKRLKGNRYSVRQTVPLSLLGLSEIFFSFSWMAASIHC